MSFASLLTSLCAIQAKSMVKDGYEKVQQWTNLATDVPCRKDSATRANFSDENIRVNTDDDIFFFNPDVTIARGHRIVLDAEVYDVIKVNKVFGSSVVHHLEVVARLVDHE